MSVRYDECRITCDFSHSRIHIEYCENCGIPHRSNTINMSKTTAEQRADATWQLALTIKNTGIPNVNVVFDIGNGNHKKHYLRLIQESKKEVLKTAYHISAEIENAECIPAGREQYWKLIEHIPRYTYNVATNSAKWLAGVIIGELSTLYEKNDSQAHFFLNKLDFKDRHLEIFMRGHFENTSIPNSNTLVSIHVNIKDIDMNEELFVLMTSHHIYYRNTDSIWTETDIENVVPCMELLRELQTYLS